MRIATILLIVLLVVVTALSCVAQDIIVHHRLNEYGEVTGSWANDALVIRLNRDTIKSRLLCTADNYNTEMPFVINGYEVINNDGYTVEWLYLDDNKKLLDRRITVWISKPIKP